MKNKLYIKPVMSAFLVHIEGGITNSSANFTTGGLNNEPLVEDWIEEKDSDDLFF